MLSIPHAYLFTILGQTFSQLIALAPVDSPPYYYTYVLLSYNPIRLISIAVDVSPYCAPSGAFCRS